MRCLSWSGLLAVVACSVADSRGPRIPDRDLTLQQALASFPGMGVTVLPERIGSAADPKGTPLAAFASRDASFSDVMLSMFKDSAINLMVDGDLSGTASFDIKASTLEETFEQMLSVYDLAYSWEGSFLRIARKDRRTFAVDYPASDASGAGGAAGSPSSPSSPNSSSSSSGGSPSSASGAASGGGGGASGFWAGIATDLTSLLEPDPDAKLLVNRTLGSVTIEGKPSSLRKVAEYLDHARRRAGRQVSLEARVLEVALNDGFKSGVNLSLLPGLFNTSNTSPLPGSAFWQQTTSGGGNALQIGYASANQFSVIVDALETQGQVRVLSSPRVSTLNNVPANIRVVEQVPIIEREVLDNTTTSRTQFNVRFVDAGISVAVTPQIGDDDTITAVVEPSIIEVAGYVNTPDGLISEPILNTRNLRTIVRVKDGQPIVMGGLRSTRRTETLSKVPLLGDIPALGMLFRSTNQTRADTEIVIVLYPRVLTPEWEREDFERGVDRVMRSRVPFRVSSLPLEENPVEWKQDHLEGKVPPSASGADREKLDPPPKSSAEGDKKILSRQGLARLALRRAYALLDSGDLVQASQDLETALASDPQSVAAWFVKGVLAARHGRTAEAERCLGHAARLAPDEPVVWNALGLLELRLDQPVAAEGRFARARAQLELPEFSNNLGLAMLAQGKLAAAQKAFQEALADPAKAPPEAHVNLAVCLDRLGRSADADREYRAFQIAGGNANDPRLRSLAARLAGATAR